MCPELIFIMQPETLLITSQLPTLPPLATTTLPSVCMNVLSLGTSYKWDHAVFVLLCLVHFSQHNVLHVHHVVAHGRNSSLLKAEYYSIVFTCHAVFIHSMDT